MQPSDLALPPRFEEFRTGQLETAVDVAATDTRFPMANAPTGSGKTVLGMAAGALAGGRMLYVVSTKGLQDQVLRDFGDSGTVDIRGANNYRCGEHRTTCDVGGEVGCLRRKSGGSCPYMAAVQRARDASSVVTNYSYRLASSHRGNEPIGKFDLVVLDESHLAHDALAEYCTIDLKREVVERKLRTKMPTSLDVGELVEWAVGVAEGAAIGARQHPQDRAMQEVAEAVGKLAGVAGNEHEWAADSTTTGTAVAPVWAGGYAEQYLYRGAPKVLLMSATLLPEMRQYLGIEPADSQWYELPSSFPARRRPFYFVRGGFPIRVDWKMDDGRWGMLVSRIDRFIGDRLASKGLVHTRSYARQGDFVRESRHRAHMLAPSSWELRKTVEKFKGGEAPSVLVSPAIEEGWDFADDDARWQVILKVPFVDTRSNVMKARAKDRSYANILAAQTIIQCAGRIVRSASDWGETCLMDDHWSWFRKAVKWPGWFRDSWVEVEQSPPPLEL